jgi:hypothetical protein
LKQALRRREGRFSALHRIVRTVTLKSINNIDRISHTIRHDTNDPHLIVHARVASILFQLLDEIPHRILIPSLPTIHLETQRFDRRRVVVPRPGLADGDDGGVFGVGYERGGLVPAEFLAVLKVMDGIWGDVMVGYRLRRERRKKRAERR